MQRRFSAMDKKLERKTAEYRAALRRTRSAQAAGGDVLKEWARSLRTLVQASLCKDVLHAGMSQLEKVHYFLLLHMRMPDAFVVVLVSCIASSDILTCSICVSLFVCMHTV
jgi:hypothetical protein